MLEDLFKFPVILIDGQNEEDKRNMSDILPMEENELDIIYGEAEYPYYDFGGIEDRWIPDKDSFNKALEGKFNGCLVKFNNAGMFLVPWTRDKFKKEISSFIKERESAKDEPINSNRVTVFKMTPDVLADLIKASRETSKEDTDE